MTETRKWTFAAIAAALVVALAGWFLLISPKRAEVAEINAATEAQEQTNAQLQTDIEVLQQKNKDLPEKQAELRALQTKIPQSEELASYIRLMQDLAKDSGVKFTTMTPTSPVPVGATADATGALPMDTLAALNVDLTVQGSYFEIADFVNELETASRYTLVTGYSITEEEEETSGEASTTDESGANADLTATVNARIFLVPTADEAAGETTSGAATTTAP